jgi:hypothetical protein
VFQIYWDIQVRGEGAQAINAVCVHCCAPQFQLEKYAIDSMQAIAASNVLDVYIALYIDPLTERQVSGAAFDAISYLHNFIDEETFVDALPRPFSFDLAQDMELQCSLEPCEEHI